MTLSFFDEDKRYCPKCADYVRFLQSPAAAYCAECGDQVILFSPEELKELRRSAKAELDRHDSRPRRRESAG